MGKVVMKILHSNVVRQRVIDGPRAADYISSSC